jgi:hypothetical protein
MGVDGGEGETVGHSFADTHSFAVRSNKPPRTEVISNEQ